MMKRLTTCEPVTVATKRHRPSLEAQNATALLNYFDSMAMAAEGDHVELTLRYVVDIERVPLFRALAGLIVDAYFRQRAVRLHGGNRHYHLPVYKNRFQESVLLSYKGRIVEALTKGRTAGVAAVGADSDTDSDASSSTTATTTTTPTDSDADNDECADMNSWEPSAIGTKLLGSDENQWRFIDAQDQRDIGQVRLFAAWWFTNFAVVLLAIRYRKELVTHALSIENRVRSVCNFNTLVPWCMNLEAELTVEDAACEPGADADAHAAAAYANCRFSADGVISNEAARLIGFVCINAMHSSDACLPPVFDSVPSPSSPLASFHPQCGLFKHPAMSSSSSSAAASGAHYNVERAMRLGNLAMNFFVREQRATVPQLCTEGTTIVQTAVEWLLEQKQRVSSAPSDTNDGRFVKGFLPRLLETLRTGVDPELKTMTKCV